MGERQRRSRVAAGAAAKFHLILNPKTCAGVPRIQRWWASGGGTAEGGLEGQLLVGKPSVFFRKTINAEGPSGRCVAVNAQQYAVLVMDVPDLRARFGAYV